MVQRGMIRFILSPLSAIMGRLSEKTKDRLFVLAGLGIFIYFFLYSGSVIRWRYLYSFVICCVLLGVMVLCSIQKDMKPVKLRLPIAVPWLLVGILMFISGLTQNVEYLPEAMLFLVAYPVLFLCWNNMDREKVFRLLIHICRISMLLFLTASFLFAEISTKRYGGIIRNVNSCAFYLALVGVFQIGVVMYRQRFDWRCLGDILLFGAVQAMIYYTNSRSGQLAVIVAAAVGVILYFSTHRITQSLQCVIRIVCCILASVVLMYSLLYIFQLRQYLPLPYYEKVDRVFYFSEMWEEKLFSQGGQYIPLEDEQDSNAQNRPEGPDPLEESFLEESTQKPGMINHASYQDFRDQKNDTTDKTLDEFTTGRITIWKSYAKDLNLLGHKDVPKVYRENGKKEINSTHMVILSVAYKSGILAGLAYVLLNFASGFLGIWFAIHHRKSKYALIPIMVTLAFGVCSMTGSIDISFNYMLTFYYYLTLFPLFQKGSLEEKKQLTAETED